MEWLNDPRERSRLAEFCRGRTIRDMVASEAHLVITFTDGSELQLGTLGGLWIDRMTQADAEQLTFGITPA